MQVIRRVVRTRKQQNAQAETAPSIDEETRDWIEGGIAERHARTRFDLLLRVLDNVEGTKHDGWQPIVARGDDTREVA